MTGPPGSRGSHGSHAPTPPEILAHYDGGDEGERLRTGVGRLEYARTRELFERYLPAPPAAVLDVGGGTGIHACPLAAAGYAVDLIDTVPGHVDRARTASAAQPDHPLRSAEVGDARALPIAAASVDAVLMLGPLYHLTERGDRLAAWREARRVVRPDGVVLAAAISRFASTICGLTEGLFADPVFVEMAARDRVDGQHRNRTNHPSYFTTAYFHHPDELAGEMTEAGLSPLATIAIEGPAWMLKDFDEWWDDPARREHLLAAVRSVETEPSLLGVSAHLMAVARR